MWKKEETRKQATTVAPPSRFLRHLGCAVSFARCNCYSSSDKAELNPRVSPTLPILLSQMHLKMQLKYFGYYKINFSAISFHKVIF